MGKRELLLIVAFGIVGAVVYQATAPPPGPNDRHVSLSGLLDKVRREMRGNRAHAEDTRISTHEVAAGMTQVRVAGHYVELTITGQNRPNIEARFRVTSNGYDEAEAKLLVQQTRLEVDRAGGALRLTANYPKPGQQRAVLTLLVPARLSVRVDEGASRTSIANVAGVEIPGIRGETSVKQVAGRVTIEQRGGRLTIQDVAALKLTTRGVDTTVTNVRADASFSMGSGELTASSMAGPIDVEAQNGEVTLKKLEKSRGPLRVNATGGSVSLEGLSGDARIDGRNTEIDVEMTRASAVAIYNQGGEPIEFTIPAGGFVLDAHATDGRITVPDELRPGVSSTEKEEEREQRAKGVIAGGGPTITLRAKHGDIRIRPRETSNPEH
jgi:hypothetical protein